MLDNAQVMRDEQVGQVALFLQALQQVDDLGLNRNIQCGDRLVTDYELRVQGKGTGDADTLALAAGELVRVTGPQSSIT